jgi:hypothetical protein
MAQPRYYPYIFSGRTEKTTLIFYQDGKCLGLNSNRAASRRNLRKLKRRPVTQYSPVDVHRRFEVMYCLHVQDQKYAKTEANLLLQYGL